MILSLRIVWQITKSILHNGGKEKQAFDFHFWKSIAVLITHVQL